MKKVQIVTCYTTLHLSHEHSENLTEIKPKCKFSVCDAVWYLCSHPNQHTLDLKCFFCIKIAILEQMCKEDSPGSEMLIDNLSCLRS